MLNSAAENEERGRGIPKEKWERQQKHYEQYGTWETPPRGTGLGGLGLELPMVKVLKGMGNPDVAIPTGEIVGMIAGGATGFLLAKKWPNFIVKWVGVIAFANLGIILARMISRRSTTP